MRGISEDSIRDWQLGAASDDLHMLAGRVTFPLLDWSGNVVSIGGRAYDGSTPKFWSYAGWPKQRYLYGLHLMKPCPFIVLVEGQVDAILIRQEGLPALAVMGSSISRMAASLLRLWTDKVIIYPDNTVPDEHAFQKAIAWIPVLESVGVEAVFPARPYPDDSAADPADLIWDKGNRTPYKPGWLRNQVEYCISRFSPDAVEVSLAMEEIEL